MVNQKIVLKTGVMYETVASIFDNKFCIPLDFEILEFSLPLYQYGLGSQLTYELTFVDYSEVIKVVDSCWISSTEWSDTYRSFFVYGKKQESRKRIYHNHAKNVTFLRRFDYKNTVLGISGNLIDKLVFK